MRQVLAGFMSPPLFPLRLDFFKAALSFRDFRPGETVERNAVVVVVEPEQQL